MSEISQIITQFIQTAPPGAAEPVIADIATLLQPNDPANAVNAAMESHFTTKNAMLVPVRGKPALIAKATHLGDSKFADYSQKLSFQYDFYTNEVSNVEPLDTSYDIAELQAQLDGYVQDSFIAGSAGFIAPRGSNEYDIAIVGERLNDSNYYNGKWVSQYRFSGSEISGNIQVSVHYYEDGNVLLESKHQVSSSSTVDGLVGSIKCAEDEFQLKLLQSIQDLNQNKFKSLRRLLPISRSKIQWGKAMGNYTLGKDASTAAL